MSQRAIRHLSSDPVMSGLIEKIRPIGLRPRRLPPFQSLTHAIIHQQLNATAAGTILGRFKKLFPDDEFPAAGRVARTSVDRLRTAGLSRPKAAYIIDLAKRCHAGLMPSIGECDRLEDEEIIARLTESKGIGRWTAEMFLIFNLGRPDVLPVDDLGVRRGFQIAYRKRELPGAEQLAKYGSRWALHRTLAARCLWRAADSGVNPNW
ncbi:MAG: DNA-3-methyladenine glycosylase 2 family protein [Verrucomicrobiota bacterium]